MGQVGQVAEQQAVVQRKQVWGWQDEVDEQQYL
jgi:hypothetical protein